MRGTVRNKSDMKRVGFLYDLEKKHKERGGKLELFESDLSKEGSFEEPLKGAHYVIHCAAVVTITSKDPKKEILEPTLKGTSSILSSILKSPSIKVSSQKKRVFCRSFHF